MMTQHRRMSAVVAVALIAVAAACVKEPAGPAGPAGPARPTGSAGLSGGPARGDGGATAQRPRAFTLVATGDVLPHDSIIQQAEADADGQGYDFRQMLAGVKPVVSGADLAICHMETVYGQEGGPYTGYPAFQSPPQVAEALAATGYDSCSTASNHTLDAGSPGIGRTLDALDAAGVGHAGSARTAAEAGAPALLTAGGAKVAQLAYTYGTNGYPLPAGRPWAVNTIDERRILADARAARKAGADVVVVSLHWGTEWQEEPDEQQLGLGRTLTAAKTGGRPDIDLILGTHAHVPQPYEKVNGTWIVYGMGDQLAGQMFNPDGAYDPRGNQSTIARFTFSPPAGAGGRWEVRKAEFLPQVTELGPPARVLDLTSAAVAGQDDLTSVRDSIARTVLGRGAAKDGLTTPGGRAGS